VLSQLGRRFLGLAKDLLQYIFPITVFHVLRNCYHHVCIQKLLVIKKLEIL